MCSIAEGIPFPADDLLFVEEDVYRWRVLEERSISGYYATSPEDRAAGRSACAQLAVRRDVAEPSRDGARRNLAYYAGRASELFDDAEIRPLDLDCAPPYTATNPSVAVVGSRRLAVVRTVNYRLARGRYLIADADGRVRTRNVLAELDSEWRIVRSTVLERGIDGAVPPCPIQGFEDCRLFAWRERLWCLATVCDRNSDGRPEIALLALDGRGGAEDLRILRGPWSARTQKNWLPLVRNGELLVVYSTDPTVVLRVEPETLAVELLATSRPASALDHLRGGSQVIGCRGGYLYLAHEVCVLDPPARVYLHRFVRLDDGFRVVGQSDPFFFTARGVEFAAGLARDPDTGHLVASFGVEDRQPMLCLLSERAVLEACRAQP